MSVMEFDPTPFILCDPGQRPAKPRPMGTPEGLGDRMRTAAFAEYQAIAAFTWAAEVFTDAPPALRQAWRDQIEDERRHCRMIMDRMAELDFPVDDRPVTLSLTESLRTCATARDFCIRIASAEERGRQAGERLCAFLVGKDEVTAALFRQIADEEVAHVTLAETFFGWTPDQPV